MQNPFEGGKGEGKKKKLKRGKGKGDCFLGLFRFVRSLIINSFLRVRSYI